MTTILITRPEPGAQSTLARLNALDIAGIAAPALVRQTLDTSLPPADGFQAMVLTSANAVRSLIDRNAIDTYRHLPVLAVGDRTAREALEAGFVKVSSAAGAFRDLINAIAISGAKGPLFYPAGKHQSADLAKALAPQGIMVAAARLYDMVAIEAFPTEIVQGLDQGRINAVLIYSRRSAEIFAKLAKNLDRSRRQRLGMLCIAEAAAEPLLDNHFHRISLADRPDDDAMMVLALAFAREQTTS